MTTIRLALANLPFPESPGEAVALVNRAIGDAAREKADIVCFPECYIPGYRAPHTKIPPIDPAFLERAWADVARAAATAHVAVILGTERVVDGKARITALVIDGEGRTLGFQDKVQLDPTEDSFYSPASERQLFRIGALTFGIAICHEGWRYPETVRWAARRGAQVVFHPHYHWAQPGDYRATTFADPRNTFHEKAVMCRAAENTVYFASVNYASDGSPTTSAVARPDGTVQAWQPYGQAGLLVTEIDLSTATGLLASRYRAPTDQSKRSVDP
jgi:predicted amidohydrolase